MNLGHIKATGSAAKEGLDVVENIMGEKKTCWAGTGRNGDVHHCQEPIACFHQKNPRDCKCMYRPLCKQKVCILKCTINVFSYNIVYSSFS